MLRHDFEAIAPLSPCSTVSTGRKREFDSPGGPGISPSGGFTGGEKKPRFDAEGDQEPGVPPATLRVLIRNSDAGGIIGKASERNFPDDSF